ncbi:MerR family transcriptional regulator [Aldersonia sp. NBC_00410]|uniref:MerR family transcriptional regulator n=1 Tax=Aldersonia sp. NBC_00410 TaxID=2975954 RepID=UPI002256AF58|nr:MerR family transcriptional regulator [Aldersonia sp. NBC_00410]MCX5046181.1 MerR family transcriptional regulator [Aldersonia sp. NBC_00410]
MQRQSSGHGGNLVTGILASLRRGPRRLGRQSRELEVAVTQLIDAALRQTRTPRGDATAEYRIDDLARQAGMTTRNVRAYRERGLLPPPRRVGRVTLYNDTHLSRLKLIASMLDRGYSIAHIDELLTAWAAGKQLGDILGIESTLTATWSASESQVTSSAELSQRGVGDIDVERLVAMKVLDRSGDTVTVLRPDLMDALLAMHRAGVGMDVVLDVADRVAPAVDELGATLVHAADDLVKPVVAAHAQVDDADFAELIVTLVHFRSLATAAVTATLHASMQSTIEGLVADHLGEKPGVTGEAESV